MIYRTRKLIKPGDLNPRGTLFGGQLLKWIDEEASIFAICQLGSSNVVTKAMSEIDFVSTAKIGDIIEFGMDLVKFGTTSVTWSQFSGASSATAGAGLVQNGNAYDVGGTANRITVSADAVDIASTYVGQTSITTLGTLTSGTWNATAIAYNYGGTGFTSYAKGDIVYASAANTLSKLTAGTDGQVLQLVSGAPAWGDLDGGTY